VPEQQRRRRRIVAATASVIAVCAGLAWLGWVWWSPAGHRRHVVAVSSTEPAVAPWVDRPASLPAPPPSPPPPSAAYPACRADQIKVRAGSAGAATGHIANTLLLINFGDRPCTLAGYPTSVTGVRADGAQVSLHAGHGTFFDGAGYWPANLQPGDHGELVVATADVCAALNQPTPQPDPYASVLVGLPGGGDVRAAVGFDAACGVDVSELGVRASPPPDPDAYPGLTATMHAPSTVPAGTLMHFTVTLTNGGNAVVALDPCPVYAESIYSDGPHEHVYELNCDTVHSIGPGESVTYAMQIPVPSTRGLAKFGWRLPAGAVFAGDVLTIT